MHLRFRRRMCARFNKVLSDTYMRHFTVKFVDMECWSGGMKTKQSINI